jgi:hypothetical protein
VADDFIAAVAANTATYEDLTGFCVLGVASAVLAGSVAVNGGPDWHEPGFLQLVVIAGSGEGKTPPFVAAKAPLDEIEMAVGEAMTQAIEVAQARKRLLEGEVSAAEKAAVKADGSEKVAKRAEVERLVIELRQFKVPAPLRFYMRDATPEAVMGVMGIQGGTIAVLTDEAQGFWENASHYNAKGRANWDIYLAGYDGQRFISDRVSRDTIDIPHATLPYLIMGQPVVLEGMGRDRLGAGLGLYARPLFAMPPTMVGRRQIERQPVPPEVRCRWRDLVHSLIRQTQGIWITEDGKIAMPPQWDSDDAEFVPDVEPCESRCVLSLDPQAQDLFDAFRRRHERRLDATTGDLGHMAEWGSKLPGQLLRLAGVAHVLRGGKVSGVIDADTMKVALKLGEYCVGHALVVFARMGAGSGVDDARHVVDWLAGRQRMTVTSKEIAMSKAWDTDRVRAALEFLERYDWVRKLPTVQGKAGRPSDQWAVNPALWDRGAR